MFQVQAPTYTYHWKLHGLIVLLKINDPLPDGGFQTDLEAVRKLGSPCCVIVTFSLLSRDLQE